MANIKIVELINGEKLIGEAKYLTKGKVTLTNSFIITPQQTPGPNGQVNFAFVPWPLFKDPNSDIFEVNSDTITVSYTPNIQVTEHYNRAMAQKSGLIIPPSLTSGISSKLLTE